MPNKKQKPFEFIGKNGCLVTLYGKSKRDALMAHLVAATRRNRGPIQTKKANDPKSSLVLVRLEEYLKYFKTFDEAAAKAWKIVSAPKVEMHVFVMTDGSRFTDFGTSAEEVLKKHLIEKTLEAGHQLSLVEASDPNRIVMVRPQTIALVLGPFDKAAAKAWQRVRAIKRKQA